MTTAVATDYVSVIEAVFTEFGIDAKVTGQTRGPSVTQYEVTLGQGVKVGKIVGLHANLAYATAAESVRILAPIPGKAAIGIELPNARREEVGLSDIHIRGYHPLDIAIGKGIDGETVCANLADMTHLLIAGTTGSGKSSFINAMLVSLLKVDPEKVNLVLIDPKMVELTPYNGVAHLMRPVITEVDVAKEALQDLVKEMEERYQTMQTARVRGIETLDIPYIVVVVDELADLMLQGDIEVEIVRLAQKARAAGIHLVLATQRPSVNVVTGSIKANIPSRLAFAASSLVDSRVILDESGAEQLLGKGDGLFKPIGARKAIRIQGALVTDAEIAAAVKDATAIAQVEGMVDRLHPDLNEEMVPALTFLNQVITDAEKASARGGEFLTKYTAKKRFWGERDGKMDLLTRTPEELGIATDALVSLAIDLRTLRDAVLEG